MRKIAVLLLLLLPIVTAYAQEAAPPATSFPTVDLLNAAEIPPRDPVDLALRLSGVTDIPAPPQNPAPLAVGSVDTFRADNSFASTSFEVEAELRMVGDHIYLWVEQGQNASDEDLQRLADEFDTLVYDQVRDLWGSEPTPGVDGDPRVHGLFVRGLGPGVAAYFASIHANPKAAVPTSNEREMFFFNLDAVQGSLGSFTLTSITAHEFQHMIRSNVDSNEDGWMDEGFSQFTQVYLGDQSLFTALAFLGQPNTQLNTWTEDGNRTLDYGASQMWVTYLHNRFGIDGLRALSADPANGMVGVDNLARQNGTTADEVFADWVLANILLDPADSPEGVYGYTFGAEGVTGAATTEYNLPIATDLTIKQYAAEYSGITRLDGRDNLTITVDAPDTVGLAAMQSPSGTPMWYSNRGDDSDMRLTFPVDLTSVSDPVLSFDLWYLIENLWDYGYVMASTDGGATWDVLQTDEMTTENPHFTAYGPGYTGRSGGGDQPVWVNQQVSLADYAGQAILLRFEMIYDDAINRPGMFIDRVQVTDVLNTDFGEPELPADWIAEGFVLTDNRLPQQVWVQAVQQIGDENRVTRWLHTGGTESYDLPLEPDVDRVVVVLSPFAPVTTVPAQMRLAVE